MTPAGQRVAVIGGGMLGLTLAHRLAQQGRRVSVLEAAPQLGGLAGAWHLRTGDLDVVWDRHYHVTLLSDSYLRGILREIGVEAEMAWVETRTGCYVEGRHYSVSNALELLRFPALSLLDKLRLGASIFYASRVRDWRRLERVPVEDWLVRVSGRRATERFWLPLLRSKLGEQYRETSAAFIWATIARLYAARRTGLRKEMFGYVRGGYARVLERFAAALEAAGVELRTGCAVASVEGKDGRVRVALRDGGEETFDRAAVTLAAPLAARVCRGLRDDELSRLRGVTYVGIVCASLLLERPLRGFYVTNLLDAWVPFTGVIEMTALVDRSLVGGKHLVYLPRYVAPGDPFFDASDAEVEELFVSALERMYPEFRRSEVLCFRVSRVRQVFALSTLGYSERLPPIHTSVPGLTLVSSAHILNGTLNVNETVQLAERVARDFDAREVS